jgi:dienelactone hydrolase
MGAAAALVTTALALPAVAQDEPMAIESTVAIPGESYDIAGTLALPPESAGAVPAVLMLHGYASSADEVGDMYGRLADALAAQGVASLRIDFAGMGASEASTRDYTYSSMTSDASTALDWLLAQGVVDPARVGVQGFSLGSHIGAHLVGTDERPLAFGSWSGAISNGSPTTTVEQIAECEATGEGHLELDLGWRTIDHSCAYFSEAVEATPLTDFAPYDGALLLIAGADDVVVDPSVSENAATASASDNVTLQVLDGADHIFHVLTEDQTLAEQVISTTADWYAANL